MLEVFNVSLALGGTPILHDVSLAARPGEVTVIVGPNGSGKSTLLKAICRDIPSQGTIRINGQDLSTLQPWQAATLRAVLPQSTTLSFPFTVREVVAIGLTAGRSGLRADRLGTLPERALERVDLAGFGGRFYSELSGGEQQRVQLARVLCQVWQPVLEGQPRYLLLDEPVSSLDIKHQLLIMDIARDFAREGGGVLAILHDLNLAALYGEKILALSSGRVAAFGTPAEVIADRVVNTVFECSLKVGAVPAPGMPFVLPQSAAHSLSGV